MSNMLMVKERQKYYSLGVCDGIELSAKELDVNDSQLLLMAGEMTAQELRTVKAVLKALQAKMRDQAQTVANNNHKTKKELRGNMKPETEFEVIDQYGARHRFSRAAGYVFEWRLKPGTDIEGVDFLDIFKVCDNEDDGRYMVLTFPRPSSVGWVSEDTCLLMPHREMQLEQCPRCGYVAMPECRI